jgi:hypothetical protein
MMRKVSPGIVWRVLFSAGLVLIQSACIKPVSVVAFLEDPIVTGITGHDNPGEVTIEFPVELEGFGDLPPELISLDGRDREEGDEVVRVRIGEIFTAVTLKVENASENGSEDKYVAFEWYFNSTDPLPVPATVSTLTLIFRVGAGNVEEIGVGIILVWIESLSPGVRYPLSVIAKTEGGKPYASQVIIEFVG